MSSSSSSFSALDRARSLQAPSVSLTQGGEIEGLEFWQTHEDLLQQAWKEWETIQTQNNNNSLQSLNHEADIINPFITEKIMDLWNHPTIEKEAAFQKDFWQEPMERVYTCRQFLSRNGIQRIREHLSQASNSGIPTRRPNGMNRHGLVLDHETQGGVSYQEMDEFRSWLVRDYLRPIARMFFPEYIGSFEDDESHYAFTIHYQNDPNKDVKLKEHSDASVVTININLNLPHQQSENYQGSDLVFLNETTQERTAIALEPGMAVVHRGLHRHQALPIEKGERHQLIIWLFGQDGYVRFVPYEEKERLSVGERWSKRQPKESDQLETCIMDMYA